MNNDYGRHVRRTWVCTHNQSIRTDPEIYLPGEVDTKDEDGNKDDSEDESDNNENELSDVLTGMKRRATTRAKSIIPPKVARTTNRVGWSSTTGRKVIDDSRPDLTLVDAPVGENLLSHPYGRHSCLYIEVKVDISKKPNPHGVVCPYYLLNFSPLRHF